MGLVDQVKPEVGVECNAAECLVLLDCWPLVIHRPVPLHNMARYDVSACPIHARE